MLKSPLAATFFHVIYFREFRVRSRLQLLPDNLEYSHYLFAGYCVDIIGRSYMRSSSES